MTGDTPAALWAPDGLFARLRAAARPAWDAYVDHAFVRQLGDGTLSLTAFRHYLAQDYLFLIHYARAYAFATVKSSTLAEMRRANGAVKNILDVEMGLHVAFCRDWGLSEAEMEAVPEAEATLAYTRYVLERGMHGDLLDLAVALCPCALGYAEICATLAARPVAGNPYAAWIAMYAGDEFRAAARATADEIDRLGIARGGDARFADLTKTFAQACRLEADFWRMGLAAAR
jgi:thiaminase/transcriptional activator TenA